MCGIAGIVSSDVGRHKGRLDDMMRAIAHRGPDGSGQHFFGNCALGHLRLSIIDLSSGQQPMLSESRDTGIVFNGEIYGFNSIKKELAGYQFKTTSDTEVILALYEKYGSRMPDKLPGMFSFAIWDDVKQELFCARDRFGEKPFFYAIGNGGEFIFASEIKALLATGLVTPVLSKQALANYLKHLYVNPHETIYSNIHVLPPASKLTYNKGKVRIETYWALPETNNTIGIDDAVQQFKTLLTNAVEKQLVSDVPIGAFLSGGLDSSTVVAIASNFKKDLKTISFGFEEGANELPFAKMVADKYHTDHVELTDKKEDIGELLLLMQAIYDEPFADSSNIPTYLISKYARKYLKVVLTGDGGDELLAGYGWYRKLFDMPDIADKPQTRQLYLKLMGGMMGKLSPRIKRHYSDEISHVEQMRRKDYYVKQHLHNNTYFTDKELLQLGLSTKADSKIGFSSYSNTLDDAMRMDIVDYMPGDILVKTDRASMASGFELRSPFLDVDFASFCISLPYSMKIDSKADKIILKKAFNDALPDEIKKRHKQGFGAPVDKWLQQQSVKTLVGKYLNDKNQKIFQVLSFEQTRPYVNKGLGYKLWILLVLAMWMDRYNFTIEN